MITGTGVHDRADWPFTITGIRTLASEVLGEDPFSGVVIVFRAKQADR